LQKKWKGQRERNNQASQSEGGCKKASLFEFSPSFSRAIKKREKGWMIWEAAPNLNLRSGWRIEGLFTRVFNGGGLEIVDKSGWFGPESLKTQAQRIN
jgi:hypothetical protein